MNNIFLFFAILILTSSCSSKEKIESVEVYKFTKVNRLPDKLEFDSSPLSEIEKEKLKKYLNKANTFYLVDQKGNIYMELNKIQNDLTLQFWSLTEEILSSKFIDN
jgi:hypothetical protein